MKVLFFILAAALCLPFFGQAEAAGESYTPEQLDRLTGPIALYPDALVALILPASTVPSDVTLAEDYLAAGGTVEGIDAQPWDASVKGLAHYPDVVKWMNGNIDWTRSLGAAFVRQPADVLKSVQQLRARAIAAGTLVDNAQQRIDRVGDNIRIVPAQADTVYVPEYDPAVVYDTPVVYAGPYVSFGVGFPAGVWLGYDLDWDDFGIWMGPWSPGWGYRRDWRHAGGNHGRAWRPDANRSRPLVRNFYRPEGRLPAAGLVDHYRAPVRPAGEVSHPAFSRPSVAPDYRGRAEETPHTPSPAPSGSLFGGYNRGTQTRDFSERGRASQSAPVRAMPSRQPSAPPAREPGPDHDARQRH